MYSVSIRNIENIAVPMMKPATFAPVTVLVRRIPKRISGSGCRSSQPTNAGEEGERRREERERLPGQPAVAAGLGDRVDEQREPARDEHRAGDVEPLHARVAALREEDRREREGDDADGDVDEEDPLPAEGVREDASEQHARGGTEAADGAPHAEGDVAVAPFGEGDGEDRERGRRDDRRAEPLERAGRDQRRLRPRQSGEERGEREDHDAERGRSAGARGGRPPARRGAGSRRTRARRR